MSFTILEFKDGLQLVPSSWLMNGESKCFFPPFLSLQRIDKAIQEKEDPESEWRIYNVQKVFGTASSYKQGIKKLNLAMRFLEIDNEPESSEESKKTKYKRRTDEIDEDCPSSKKALAPLQILQYLPQDQNVQVLLTQPFYSGVQSSHIHSEVNHTNLNLSSLPSEKENFERSELQKYLGNFQKEVLLKLDKLEERLETMDETNKKIESKDKTNEKNESIDKINEKLENIKEKLEEIMKNKESDINFDEENIFPINSIKELEEFEKKLKDESYFIRMVKFFQRIGGLDICNSTTNILKKMLSDEVSKQFSWRGMNDKKTFSSLTLNKVIFEAIKIHCSSATEVEIYNSIARCLVYAKTRVLRSDEKKRKSLPAQLK